MSRRKSDPERCAAEARATAEREAAADPAQALPFVRWLAGKHRSSIALGNPNGYDPSWYSESPRFAGEYLPQRRQPIERIGR